MDSLSQVRQEPGSEHVPVRFWDRWRRLSAVSSRSHLEGPKVKEKTFVEDQGHGLQPKEAARDPPGGQLA